MRLYLLFSILFFVLNINAQSEIIELQKKNYTELSHKVRENLNDEQKALVYAKAYLIKAKTENSQMGIATGYRLHSNIHKDKSLKIVYLDSAINKTLNMDNVYYPALLLLHRGGIYDDQKKYKLALNDYILANKYAKKNNEELYYTIKYNIGMLKRQIGNYKEAEEIFLDCLSYESNYKDFNNGEMYFGTLFQLSNIFYETKQFSKAKKINIRGIRETLKRKDSVSYYHFVVNEGINLTIQKEYFKAIDSMKKALPFIKLEEDLSIVYHYLGTALYESNQKDASLKYFKKVDSIFIKTNDLIPSVRSTYEKLINYYKGNKNQTKQLLYTNRLLHLDSILDDDYKYLVKNLYKEYDFPELLNDQKELIANLKNKANRIKTWNISLFITSFSLLIGFIYFVRQKKIYKKRFDKLIDNQISQKNAIASKTVLNKSNENISKSLDDIDPETIKKILKGLDSFVQNKSFLKKQISLNATAKIVNTNSKYLSRIINFYYEKNFTTYINDLRVDYLIEKLNKDIIFRKYTLSAIAEEGGFSNSLSFSRAFFKKTGLKPSYFMKELNKKENNLSIP